MSSPEMNLPIIWSCERLFAEWALQLLLSNVQRLDVPDHLRSGRCAVFADTTDQALAGNLDNVIFHLFCKVNKKERRKHIISYDC